MKKSFSRTVEDIISRAHIIIYLLDARFPNESRNAKIEREIENRKKSVIYVFTKSDLLTCLPSSAGIPHPYVFFSAKDYRGIRQLKQRIWMEAKKMKKERPKVGVVGYPNVGKSSLINALKGKAASRISSEPGTTKGQQYVTVGNILLIDTPGVIPRRATEEAEENEAYITMSIHKYDAQSIEESVYTLMDRRPDVFRSEFGVDVQQEDKEATLEEIALKKRFLLRKGVPDVQRAARAVLAFFQRGKVN